MRFLILLEYILILLNWLLLNSLRILQVAPVWLVCQPIASQSEVSKALSLEIALFVIFFYKTFRTSLFKFKLEQQFSDCVKILFFNSGEKKKPTNPTYIHAKIQDEYSSALVFPELINNSTSEVVRNLSQLKQNLKILTSFPVMFSSQVMLSTVFQMGTRNFKRTG